MDEFCFFHPRNTQLAPVKTTLDKRAIGIIISAINSAWGEIETFTYWKSSAFDTTHYSDEDELTTKIAEILNDKLCNGSGGRFRKEKFQAVVRDGKQSTASTSSTEQMPDLTFRMISTMPGEDPDESAFFVEAKLVSQSSGCHKYVTLGLHRFVSGKYAPRMQLGLMLGYGTDTFCSAPIALNDYFSKAKSAEALLCKSAISLSDFQNCFASEHTRPLPCAPQFLAFHLWLIRPSIL
jgi:hypothetical protein